MKKFNSKDSKPHSTSMEVGYLRNDIEDNLPPNNTKFRQEVSFLFYVETFTRLDIMAVASILSHRNEGSQ